MSAKGVFIEIQTQKRKGGIMIMFWSRHNQKIKNMAREDDDFSISWSMSKLQESFCQFQQSFLSEISVIYIFLIFYTNMHDNDMIINTAENYQIKVYEKKKTCVDPRDLHV